MRTPTHYILPTIVIAQFLCTSLWFAGNGVLGDLILDFNLTQDVLGHLTAAVQFGFIIGSLLFAILTITDRFSPSRVFFVSALLGAVFNLGTIWSGNNLFTLLVFRFSTGFFLAGIYPVGMKIAADYFDKKLGKSLGLLVGALVVGTALPHLMKEVSGSYPWQMVIVSTSLLAVIGGILVVILVPDGPYRKASAVPDFTAFFKVFSNSNFRKAAFGYFGHMWELYAFWAFVPVIISTYSTAHPAAHLNNPLLSFSIIAIGGLGCIVGGSLSQRFGSNRIAFFALLISGICCLASPLILGFGSRELFIVILIIWGTAVVADSPQFSTLIANNSTPEIRGTALTIVNAIGFLITIFSIQLLSVMNEIIHPEYLFLLLAPGPLFGLLAMKKR